MTGGDKGGRSRLTSAAVKHLSPRDSLTHTHSLHISCQLRPDLGHVPAQLAACLTPRDPEGGRGRGGGQRQRQGLVITQQQRRRESEDPGCSVPNRLTVGELKMTRQQWAFIPSPHLRLPLTLPPLSLSHSVFCVLLLQVKCFLCVFMWPR